MPTAVRPNSPEVISERNPIAMDELLQPAAAPGGNLSEKPSTRGVVEQLFQQLRAIYAEFFAQGTEVDQGRRAFLGQTLAVLGVFAGINMLHPDELNAQELDQKLNEGELRLLEAVEKEPSTLIVDILMTLNFIDAVYALSKDNKNPYTSILPAAILGKIGLHSVSESMHHADHHFPHTSVLVAAVLNLARAMHGEQAKAEVLHGIEEAVIGVGMLYAATSVGAGIQASETKRIAAEATQDQELRDEAMAEGANFELSNENVNEYIDAQLSQIWLVIGGAPFSAALSQVPLFAFGNASIARNKMLTAAEMLEVMFAKFEKLSKEQLKDLHTNIKNPQVRNFLGQALQVENDNLQINLQNSAKAYAETVCLGLMSSTMDVTQAAIGDVGPSVVGAIQSFGFEQMLKSALTNSFYTLILSLEETYFLAQRLGVGMVNNQKKILEGVKADFLANWENLFRYAIAADSNENGAKYDVFDSVKTDATHFGSAVSQAANTFFNTILGNEIPNDNVLKGRALDELNEIFAQRNGLIAEHVNLNEQDTIALSELSLMATQSLISAFDTSAGNINQDTQNAFKGVFEEVKKLNYDEKLAATELSNRLDEFQQLIGSVENVPNFSGKLGEIAHLLSKKPHLFDLFNFSYWEQHVGPSLAETMFVVFMQGMHLVGLISTLDKTVYSNVDKVGDVLADTIGGKETTIGKFAKEATFQVVATGVNGAFSGVADNWANQVAHAKQQARRFITEIGLRNEIFQFAEDFDKQISIGLNVTEKFMTLTRSLETKNGGPLSAELYHEIYEKYAIAKCMSISCAVFGGGESTIGNSPHFTAIVGKLKEIITLGGSIKDVVKEYPQHLARAALTCVYGTLVGPKIEMTIFANPFLPNPIYVLADSEVKLKKAA